MKQKLRQIVKSALPLDFDPKCKFLQKRNVRFSLKFQNLVFWAQYT